VERTRTRTQSAEFISTSCIRIVLRGTLKPSRVNAESRSRSSSIAYTRPYKREMTGYRVRQTAFSLRKFPFRVREDIFVSLSPLSLSLSLSLFLSIKARPISRISFGTRGRQSRLRFCRVSNYFSSRAWHKRRILFIEQIAIIKRIRQA